MRNKFTKKEYEEILNDSSFDEGQKYGSYLRRAGPIGFDVLYHEEKRMRTGSI